MDLEITDEDKLKKIQKYVEIIKKEYDLNNTIYIHGITKKQIKDIPIGSLVMIDMSDYHSSPLLYYDGEYYCSLSFEWELKVSCHFC
jgi:hypothetical protein